MLTDAANSLALARAARESGNLPECLYRATAAVGYARREQDHESAFQALQCMGRLHLARQEPREARGYYEQAANYVKEQGMIRHVGGAYHDLLLVGVELGDKDLAGKSASVAFEFYGRRDRVSTLVADLALPKMEDDPAHCYYAWRAAYHDLTNPRDRLYAYVNVVEAASHLSASRFDQHWPLLLEMLGAGAVQDGIARILCAAAESALRRDRKEDAHRLAERAVAVATERGEAVTRERAEWLKDRADA